MTIRESVDFQDQLESLKPIRDLVKKYAIEVAIEETSLHKLITAVDEIATNIILHGYQEAGRTGNVVVQVEVTDKLLIITLEDEGIPFDPLNQELPDETELNSQLDIRAIGGLGIYLTIKGVDDFKYEFVDGKNRNIFIMNRPTLPESKKFISSITSNRILIAEADMQLRGHLTSKLQSFSSDLEVIQAGNATELYERLQADNPHVLVLGIGLPELDYEVLFDNVSNKRDDRVLDVVMLRTPETTDTVIQYLQKGANDYIDADLPPYLLNMRIREALTRSTWHLDGDFDMAYALELSSDLKNVVLPFGLELSKELSIEQLSLTIIEGVQSLCNADGASLWLSNDNQLTILASCTQSLGIEYHHNSGNVAGFGVPPPIPLIDPITKEENHSAVSAHVANSGEMVHIPDVYEVDHFDFLGAKEFDKKFNFRTTSVLSLPLKNNTGAVIGVLQVINAMNSNGEIIPFSKSDQLAAEALSIQAAIALNNYLLRHKQIQFAKFEVDLDIGRQVQLSFLPHEIPQPEGWDIAARFHPARQVAGDFYDIFKIKEDLYGLVMADVTDKGVPAALFMALTRSLLRAFSLQNYPLSWMGSLFDDDPRATGQFSRQLKLKMAPLIEGLKRTNEYLVTNHSDLMMFATMFYALLDVKGGGLMYINGGHNPPLIIGSDGIRMKLKPTGPVVGMGIDLPFKAEVVQLNPGETLMTFTDGVTEARAPSREFFGDARLETLLQARPIDDATSLLDHIQESLFEFIAEADQFDDITMMAVRRLEEQ